VRLREDGRGCVKSGETREVGLRMGNVGRLGED
jgi:hypothetical protein